MAIDTLQGDGNAGRIATYEGPSEAPFTSPLANISKIGFHTDFEYVGIERVMSFSISLNSIVAGQTLSTNIGAHQASGGIPLLIGVLESWTVKPTRPKRPMTGTVLLDFATVTIQGESYSVPLAYISLYATSSNVFVDVVSKTWPPPANAPNDGGPDAPTGTIAGKVYVTNARLPA